MGPLILDAQPLIAVIADEPLAPEVVGRLEAALAFDRELLVSSVNWGEVLYMTHRLLGEASARRAIHLAGRLPLAVVSADDELATYAADVKARFGLGLGDSFAAGLALALGAPLLTGDTDFLPLAEHGLQIDWVGEDLP